MSTPQVELRSPIPPFALRAVFDSAHNVDRVLAVEEPGTLTFSLATNEANRFRIGVPPVPPSGDMFPYTSWPNMREGDAVVVRSTEGIQPELWIVDGLEDDAETGMITVECREWRDLLYRRQVPLSYAARSRSAPAVAREILAAANGRNPTYIRGQDQWMSGSRYILPDEELSLGGNTVGAAFDELAARTDLEWWVEYRVSWKTVQPILRWSERRGMDRALTVVIDQWRLAGARYRRDQVDLMQTDQLLGAGDDIATAPAGAQVVGAAVATTKPALGGRIERADTFTERLALNRNVSPGSTSERAEVLPSETSDTSLLQTSSRRQRLPIGARQALEIELRYPWPGSPAGTIVTMADVGPLRPGDIIRVRMTSALFGRGLSVFARILAMQPDEASGILGLVVEIQAGTVQWLRGMET